MTVPALKRTSPQLHTSSHASILQRNSLLPRTSVQPARLKQLVQAGKQQHIGYQSNKSADTLLNYFIALGLKSYEPGYHQLLAALSKLGNVAHFNNGLVYLSSIHTIDQVFKRINKSIIDPRIPNNMGLMIIDPKHATAKWCIHRVAAELLFELWHTNNNVFVCTHSPVSADLFDGLEALGDAVPVSDHIWYLNTAYSPKEVYQILTHNKPELPRLTVFDAAGRVRSWQSDLPQITVEVPIDQHNLPQYASIHTPDGKVLPL